MKKFLSISLMAVLLLSSCVEENVIERSDDHAIVFENTFVDKATRSDITTDNIDEFSVYGYKNSWLGILWENERVYKRETTNDATGQSYATPTSDLGSYPQQTGWTYDNLAYWEEGNSYYFHGIAPYEDKNDSQSWTFVPDKPNTNPGPVTGTISVNNSNFDLVYAYHQRDVEEGGLGSYVSEQPDPINFTFQHLFARVRIRIINELSNKYNTIYIMNLKTSQLVTEASAKVPFTNNVEWVLGDEKSSIACLSGNEVRYLYHSDYDGTLANENSFKGEYISEPFYVIPQSLVAVQNLFTFTAIQYYYLMGGKSKMIQANMADDFTFEAGKSYQFTVRLTDRNFFELFHLIQFDDIEVTDWEEDVEGDITYY